MKTKIKRSISYLVIFSLIACHPFKNRNWEKTEDSLIKLDSTISDNTDIIILPNQGCEGCISAVEDYVMTNFPKLSTTRIIFTRINSVKLLKIRMGDDIFHAKNVTIDSTNIFEYPEAETVIYPVFLKVRNKKIIDFSVKNPENAFNY